MDSVILVFVAVIFAVSLTCCFTTAVLCSKKINYLNRKIKKIEKIVEEDR